MQQQYGRLALSIGKSCVYVAGRRSSKLVSLVTSCFTGSYVRWWAEYFPGRPLQCTPMFDGRAVCYPSDASLRDYLAWRQADAHINNQASALGFHLEARGLPAA